jgi:hypothetical protein
MQTVRPCAVVTTITASHTTMQCWAFHYRQLAKTSTEIRISDLLRLQVQAPYHHWTHTMRTPCVISHHPYLGFHTLRHLRQGIQTLHIATFPPQARPRRIPVDSLPLQPKIRSTLQTVHSVLGKFPVLPVPTPMMPPAKLYRQYESRLHLLPIPLSRRSIHNLGANFQLTRLPTHHQTHTRQHMAVDCRQHTGSPSIPRYLLKSTPTYLPSLLI